MLEAKPDALSARRPAASNEIIYGVDPATLNSLVRMEICVTVGWIVVTHLQDASDLRLRQVHPVSDSGTPTSSSSPTTNRLGGAGSWKLGHRACRRAPG